MQEKYLIFFGIIIGAFIIGGFVYAGLVQSPLLVPVKTRGEITSSAGAVPTQNSMVVPASQPAALSAPKTSACGASNNTVVTKVIDGDTVVVEGGYHVRLLGMDADEKNYPCYDSAKTRLEQWVLGKQVVLEKDMTDVDQYGRCLRTIFLGGENIDAKLVREGLAVARFYPPDVKYKQEITAMEAQAIGNKTGCKWNKQ